MADTISVLDSDPAPTATLVLEDAAGLPSGASPDAPPVWAESSSGTVVIATASTDGLSCTFKPVAPGVSNVTVTLMVATVPYTGTGVITVTGGTTTQIAINFTPGADAPPATPPVAAAPADPTAPPAAP